MSVTQPYVAYAKIYFGSTEVTSDKTLLSFNYERSTTAGSNNATFTLADPKWDNIEQSLLDASGQFSFEYGFVDNERWSKRYKLVAQKYTPKITNEHIEISVEGKTIGHPKSNNKIVPGQTNKVLPPETMQAVKKMYEEMGFKTVVDKVDIHEKTFCDTAGTLPKNQEHVICSVSPLQYTRHFITKYAATGENKKQGGYYFYFSDEDGQPTVYFKKSWDFEGPKYAFEVPDTKNYEVISFEPEMNLPALRQGEGQARKTLKILNNSTGKDIWAHREKNETTPLFNHDLFKHKFFDATKGDNNTAQNHPYVIAGSTFEQARQVITSLYEDRALYVNKATLQVVGDPKFELLDVIHVSVYKRGIGVDGSGTHYSTGNYLIVGIVDAVQPGSYITTLQLKRIGVYDPLTTIKEGEY